MTKLLFVSVALFVAGCSKTKCEKYADIEVKCGGIPAKEEDITRKLAEGMCEAADKDKSELAQHFKKEAECAAKFSDCAQYKACTEAAK
jgi:hypothetical protein